MSTPSTCQNIIHVDDDEEEEHSHLHACGTADDDDGDNNNADEDMQQTCIGDFMCGPDRAYTFVHDELTLKLEANTYRLPTIDSNSTHNEGSLVPTLATRYKGNGIPRGKIQIRR
eukprot:c30799_g1_i1 orf=3-344(-)